MDFEYLKKNFGDKVVFWGAIDEQQLLPHGTPEQIRAETRRAIDILGKGGGYICGPAHNIQSDVPPENFFALCDAAYEYTGCK